MRALCKDWTQGSPAAFAVLDGVGDVLGRQPTLCDPGGPHAFLAQWTTTTNYTQSGSPYLWWTGPDDAAILQALVSWGKSKGTDRRARARWASSPATGPATRRLCTITSCPTSSGAGVTPVVETIAAETSETATTNSDAPLVVEKLRAAGVTSVIPLIPFNAFLPVLSAQTAQKYFPKLLLSDYESSIESSLGLIPVPYEKALNGQEGVTTETLGGIDDPRPESPGAMTRGSGVAGRRGTRRTRRSPRAT